MDSCMGQRLFMKLTPFMSCRADGFERICIYIKVYLYKSIEAISVAYSVEKKKRNENF